MEKSADNSEANQVVNDLIEQIMDGSVQPIKNIYQVQKEKSILMDMTNLFKENIPYYQPKIEQQDKKSQEVNKIANAKTTIPDKLQITQEDMRQRRFLDQRRWYCISRPQYQRSCGISSLVSVWNYLFSTLGTGDLQPISQEEAIQLLGIVKDDNVKFEDVEFGCFTGNMTLVKWFKLLLQKFKKDGRAYIMWKHSGEDKTQNVDGDYAKEKLIEGLKSENQAFIYHCYDHYCCPIGFEITTIKPIDAFKKMKDIDPKDLEYWIMIGDPAKFYPCMHIRKWKDIEMDIKLESPFYYDMREAHKGVIERKGGLKGGSLHCIIAFQKVIKQSKKIIIKEETKKQQVITQNIQKQDQEQMQQTVSENVAGDIIDLSQAQLQSTIEEKSQEINPNLRLQEEIIIDKSNSEEANKSSEQQ